MEESIDNFNKLLFHPSFRDTIAEISELDIQIPQSPASGEMDFHLYSYPKDGKLLSNIEDVKNYKLNPKKGEKLINDGIPISAYDESINKFMGLEGTAFITSHSIVIHGKSDYIPSNFITFYFYTRSKTITEKTKFIKYSEDPESDSKLDYITDRTEFIVKNTPSNSVMLIDGPLIGGQASSYTIKLNNRLLEKNVIPLFLVKNSTSNLVTDHTEELTGKYNSDMHWAYETLSRGERTSFFKYVDQHNPNNAKLFCYLKAFNISPQRIEFHISTFEKHEDRINDLMDLIYYLILVQGDLENPQARSIAIAEKYARSTLKLIDLTKLMKEIGIASTINQERFGWS